MAKTIQELRREAGYRSGREFAAALGVSPSTYSRYEASPDSIPLKQAWAMADLLGCSIDMVVGREHVEVADMRGDVQKLYDGLSSKSQYLMDDYLEYLQLRDEAAERERQEAEDQLYRNYAEYYEKLFLQEAEDSAAFGDMVVFGSETDRRLAFERFITERARAKREADISRECEELEVTLSWNSGEPILDENDEIIGFSNEPIAEGEELEWILQHKRAELTEKWEARDGEVIEKIMEAYDKIHAQTRLPLFGSPTTLAIEYTGDWRRP